MGQDQVCGGVSFNFIIQSNYDLEAWVGLFWGFYVTLTIFQWLSYRNLEAGVTQSFKIQVERLDSNRRSLAPQAKSLTTTPQLPYYDLEDVNNKSLKS